MLKFSDATKQAKLKTLVEVEGLKRYLAKGRKGCRERWQAEH